METNKSEPLINCRKRRNAIKTGEESLTRDESGGAQADFIESPGVGIQSGHLFTVQAVTGMEEASTLHRLCTRTWEPVRGCKGANPSRRTARNGSPMPFTGAEQSVVVVKSICVDGAKGLYYPVILSGQPRGRNRRV